MVNHMKIAIVLWAVNLCFPRVCVPDGELVVLHGGEVEGFSGTSK